MKKTSLFVITVIILLAGTSYAAWNVFVDDTTTPMENNNSVVENTNENINNNTTVQTNTNTTVNTNSTNTNSQNNTNTSDEVDTSDWLTYENEEYSFKYPKEWIANEGLYGSVKLSTKGEEIGIISIERDKTIDDELNIDADIKHTLIESLTIDGYNSARVYSVGELVGRVEFTKIWVEINNDLIRMPDINEFPELEQVIASFEIFEK